MTCIAGLVDQGIVWIGGDSAGVSGSSMTIRADEKVFRNDGMIFGFTTSFRMGDILRYQMSIPTRGPNEDPRAYMVGKFIPNLRTVLREQGWLSKDKDREEAGTFLVGVAGRLFRIGDDLQVGESADGYDAVGSGHDIAKGALYVLQTGPAESRIQMALSAAERHNSCVRQPFVIISNGDA